VVMPKITLEFIKCVAEVDKVKWKKAAQWGIKTSYSTHDKDHFEM
jgi:hypothetical protein